MNSDKTIEYSSISKGYRERIKESRSEDEVQALLDKGMKECKNASSKTRKAWLREAEKRLSYFRLEKEKTSQKAKKKSAKKRN